MKLQTSPINKRGRQERALERRRKELRQWELQPADIFQRCPEGTEIDFDTKIEAARAEIASLEKKLAMHHD